MKKNRILISTLACLWLIWPKLNADADNECNAVETARMILNVIRIEHAVWVAEKELQGDAARASQLLVEFLSQPESSWKKHIHNRSGPAAEIIARLKATLANLEIPSPDDDPAAVITQILADRADNPAADNPLFHTGYAAAFLLNMEEKRDSGLMQDLLRFLVMVDCPLTLRDIGFNRQQHDLLKTISREAAERTAPSFYRTDDYQYFLTFERINTWSERYSGQLNPDIIASKIYASNPELKKQLQRRFQNYQSFTIVSFGDSQTAKLHWAASIRYPEILNSALQKIHPDFSSINAGIGGNNSGQGLSRMDRDVLPHNPDYCFIMFGGNDSAHWGREHPTVNVHMYEAFIREMIRRLLNNGSKPVLMNTVGGRNRDAPSRKVLSQMHQCNRRIANELNIPLIDIAGLIENSEMELYAIDNIHINQDAQIKIARTILQFFAEEE